MNEKLPATAKDTGKFFLPAPSERSVLSTVIFFLPLPADTCSKAISVCRSTTTSKKHSPCWGIVLTHTLSDTVWKRNCFSCFGRGPEGRLWMCQLALLCIPLNPGDLSQAGHSGVTPCCMNEVNPLAFMTPLTAAAAANRLR